MITEQQYQKLSTESIPEYNARIERLRNLDAMQGGESAASLGAGRTPSPEMTSAQNPYQIFGTKLMDMLKQYQKLGTGKFQEASLRGREEQAGRVMAEAEPGMPPSLQAQVRSASAGAMEPTIQGAQGMQKTFAEQIAGLGDTLSRAQAIGEWMESQEIRKQQLAQNERKEKQDLMLKQPSAYKAWFATLDPKQQKTEADSMGVGAEFIVNLPEEEQWKQITLNDGSLAQQNTKTGEINVLIKKEQPKPEDIEAKTKAKSEALMNLNNIRQLLQSPGLPNIFGAQLPVTGEAIYAKKLYDQVKNTLTVANRSKLKGQGTVSDWEGKLLESASSALSRWLKDKDAIKELKKVKAAFTAYAGLPVDVKVTDQKTGQSHSTTLTPEDVEDAISQGYLIEYQ